MTISIYMATKNRVRKLKEAVESVLAQDYQAFELIVVDDGSEDGTSEYLSGVAAHDSRVKFLQNETSAGAQISRNRAIEHATGDFITGLDDDDRFHPRRLGVLLDSWATFSGISSETFGLYTQDAVVVDDVVQRFTKKRGSVGYDDFPSSNRIGNQIFAPRSYVEAVGRYDVTMPAWQDMELFVRLAKRYGKARLIDLPLYYYDDSPRPDRISQNEDRIRRACSLMIEKHYPDNSRSHQALWLQVFAPHYGIRPGLADFVVFQRKGLWLGGLVTLASSAVRNGRTRN